MAEVRRPTMIARSTASRSSSLPWRHVDDVADAGTHRRREQPVPRWSRTSTMAVPGAVRPTNSARPSASGSLTSGESTRTSIGFERVDEHLLRGRGGLHPADLLGLALERAGQLLRND